MTMGPDIVTALILDDQAILAAVPEARIKMGALPDGIPLPALLVTLTSSVEIQPLKRGPTTLTRDRVSVTIRANSYREQRAIIALVKNCCAGRTGDLAGALRVAVLTDGTGPDLRGPGNSYEQTQDFKVSYDA